MLNMAVMESAERISASISECIKEFSLAEQERILGLVQGMAIVRGLQEQGEEE